MMKMQSVGLANRFGLSVKKSSIGADLIVLATFAVVWIAIPENPAYSQEAAVPAEAAPVEAPEVPEALKKLNQAIDRKMTAARMSDLEKVVGLCEEAIEGGLDERNETFARELMSASLYEQADRLVNSLEDGKMDLAWIRRRKVALSSLEKAIEVNKKDVGALLLLADLHKLPNGDKEAGLEAAEKAVALINDDPQRRSAARMTVASYREKPEEQLSDYDAAIEDDPKNAEALRERGKVHLGLGKADKALGDFKSLLEIDSTDFESLQIVSGLLASKEKYDEAIELIDGVIEEKEASPEGYILRASVLSSKKDYEPALKDLGKALELEPRNLAALLTRAQVHSSKEDYTEALADVTRALELRPGMFRAIALRSEIALAAGEYKQSLADYRSLLRTDPSNVGLKMQIAAVYVADDRPNLAINMYDQILEKDDEMWAAYRGRADAYLGMGEHGKAVDDYNKAIEGMPEDSGLLNNFAWLLSTSTFDTLRDGQRAVKLAERACKVTEYKAAHILSTLAASYAETGDFDKAVEWSTKAVKMGEGEVVEQLAQELASYKEKKPWREKQEVPEEEKEDLEKDLGDN